jgi:hypothetical protein
MSEGLVLILCKLFYEVEKILLDYKKQKSPIVTKLPAAKVPARKILVSQSQICLGIGKSVSVLDYRTNLSRVKFPIPVSEALRLQNYLFFCLPIRLLSAPRSETYLPLTIFYFRQKTNLCDFSMGVDNFGFEFPVLFMIQFIISF